MLVDGVGYREAARVAGVCRAAVGRWALKWRQLEPSAEEVHFESQSGVCEVHGRVTVWPCVACAAAHRGQSSRSRHDESLTVQFG